MEDKDLDVLNPLGFDALLDCGRLALWTTLEQINRFIKGQLLNAKPKWVRDGRVLSDSLSIEVKHLEMSFSAPAMLSLIPYVWISFFDIGERCFKSLMN